MVLPVAMLLLALAAPMAAGGAVLEGVEVLGERGEAVRLRLSASVTPSTVRALPSDGDNPERVYLDLPGTSLLPATPRAFAGRGHVRRVRAGQFDLTTTRVVIDREAEGPFRISVRGSTVLVELGPPREPAPAPARRPPAAGEGARAPASRAGAAVDPPPVAHAPPAPAGPPPEPTAAPPAPLPPLSDAARPPLPQRAAPPAPPTALASLSAAATPPLPRRGPVAPPARVSLSDAALPSLPRVAPPREPAPAAVPADAALSTPAAPPAPATAPPAVALAAPAPTDAFMTEAPAADAPTTAAPAAALPATRRPPSPGDTVIIVDAGHGGRDPGAEGVGGILEKDVALGMSRVLAERLLARLPVSVVLTRADDSFVPLERRLALPSEGATLFLSLHANAYEHPSARGLEVFYGGGPVRTASAAAASPRAAVLGHALRRALDTRIGGVRGEARAGTFTVLVRNPVPSALIELGYLTHPEDAARAQDPAYQTLLAEAIVDGVEEFLRASAPPL